jgi:hypothetical protein
MMGFRLQLKQLPDGRLIFTIPLGYKILLFLIGLLILISLIITRQEGSGSIFVRENTIPLIICFLSFLGAAYHERWIFNRVQDQVIYQHGIFALHSNKVYRINDLERVEISQFVKGKLGSGPPPKRGFLIRPVLTLSLHTFDGQTHRIETYNGSQRKKLETVARAIAEYCRIRYLDKLDGSEDG